MQLQPGLPHGAPVAAVPLLDLAYLTAMLGDDGVDLQFVHESSLSVTRPESGPQWGNTRVGTNPKRNRGRPRARAAVSRRG